MKTINKSSVELIDHLGNDLTIVNAARVSFDKESKWEEQVFDTEEEAEQFGSVDLDWVMSNNWMGGYPATRLSNKDEKLINYLAKHNHWSPFAHTSIQLRVTAPIFVARQLVKHQVGGVWNEVSRRYVDDEPTFYFPAKWRKRAENKKQGSSDETVNVFDVKKDVEVLLNSYNLLLEQGVAPEQARMVLPQNMVTSWYWTGSLMFFHRVYKQRTDSHAQLETQEVAKQIGSICAELFPTAWSALNEP
jgi:thymidylate synthase (FAD)